MKGTKKVSSDALLEAIYRGITRRCIVCRNSMEDDGDVPTSTHRQNGECPAKMLWDTFGVEIVKIAWGPHG